MKAPVVLLGTSSGGISATLLAQFADTGAQAGQHVADVWTSFGAVFDNPLFGGRTPRVVGRTVLGELIEPVSSLLDTTPLRTHAEKVFEHREGRRRGGVRSRTWPSRRTTASSPGRK